MSSSELEPVVFEVLAEIASAEANLLKIKEELAATAAAAQESGTEMAAALADVSGSLSAAASSAAEAGAFVGSSMASMDAAFADVAGSAETSGAAVESALSDVGGSVSDAAGAAADASATISDAMDAIGGDSESAAGSIDDASNEMTESFTAVSAALAAASQEAAGMGSEVQGSMVMLAESVGAAAEAVVGAQEQMAAAMTETGAGAETEAAKIRTAGHEAAAAGKEGALGIKQMAEAFGLFEAFHFLKESVTDAMDAEAAMNILNTAITKTGASAKAMAPDVEEVDRRMGELGFAAADSNTGLAKLTQMLGNSQQAMRLESLAADLARAKHIDLGAAIRTVGMAATGHVGLLARLGLQTKDAAGHTLSAKAAIDAMAHSFAGTAQAYSTTMAGKMDVFKAQMEEARAKVGNALIPALQQLMPIFVQLANFIANDVAPAMAKLAHMYQDHRKSINGLVVTLGAFWLMLKVNAAATKAYAVVMGVAEGATKLWKIATREAAVAQEGLDAALTANPIGLVIAAIVALAAAMVYAWKHSEEFRDIVIDVWQGIEKGVGEAVSAIINYWIKPMIDWYLMMASAVVWAVDKAFGWVPKLSGKLDKAKQAVSDFTKATNDELSKWADNAQTWGGNWAKGVTDAHKAVKKEAEKPFKAGNYSAGLSADNGTTSRADKHKKTNAQILADQKAHERRMLEEARRAAKEREQILKEQMAAAKLAAAQREAILKQQLAHMKQMFDFAQQQLEASSTRSIQYINGQLANVGLSMLALGQLGALGPLGILGSGSGSTAPQASQTVVNVNVAGSVVTQQQLVGAVQQGLLVKQRTNASLGFKAEAA